MMGYLPIFPIFPLLLLLTLTFPSTTSATCYYANGSNETDPAYEPCADFTGVRMCCATNRVNPPGYSIVNGWTRDICLPNGLCLNISNSTDEHGQLETTHTYWRDSCTSDNWKDTGCVSACVGDATNHSSSGTVVMTPCDGTNSSATWCCGSTTSCCDTAEAEVINQKLASYTGDSTNSTNSTDSTTSSSPSSSSGLSTGAKAGIGIGVTVGAIALLALLAFAFLFKRKGNKPESSTEPLFPQAQAQTEPQIPQEMYAGGVIYEMPGNESPSLSQTPKSMTHEMQDESRGRLL